MALDRVGKSDILAGYDLYEDHPFFALFEDNRQKDLKFSYTGNDREEGKRLLAQNLEVLERSGTEAVYKLRFYSTLDKSGTLKDSTPCNGSFTFRMKQPTTLTAAGGASSDQFTQFLMSERQLLTAKLEDQQEELEEIRELLEQKEAIGTGQVKGIIGQIGRVGMEFPWMQDIIKDLVNVAKNIFVKAPGHNHMERHIQPDTGGIAGVDADQVTDTEAPPAGEARPDERLHAAINKLTGWYILHCAELNKKQFAALDDETKEAARITGFVRFVEDMEILAKLTNNPQLMKVALSNLRALA